jgi:hypothetical protein
MVDQFLEIRVRNPRGPLIQWRDRGYGGRMTWCWEDGRELRDIRQWVYDDPAIMLVARCWSNRRAPRCTLDILYSGNTLDTWHFAGEDRRYIRVR